jgi:hypothetical protein
VYPPNPILIVSCKKLGNLSNHVGLLLPDRTVAHCSPTRGVAITTQSEFANGTPIVVIGQVQASQLPSAWVRLSEALATRRPYNPATWNCEHFMTWVAEGNPVSPQMAYAAFGAALVSLVGIAVVCVNYGGQRGGARRY